MSALHGINTRRAIVLGCPRSGTTFLLNVLDALPGVACLSGSLLPIAVPHLVNRELDAETYDVLAVGFERALVEYLDSGLFHARAAALQKWLAAPNAPGELLSALQGGRRDAPELFVYKEPFLSLAPEFVFDALPDAKVIYVYRDGRDCAHSLVRTYNVLTDEKLTHLRSSEMRRGRPYDHRYVPWWVERGREEVFIESTPYVRAIWMWKYMVRRCHDAFSSPDTLPADQVLQIRYEDFMRNPHPTGRTLLNYLGLPSSVAFDLRLSRAHTDSIGNYTCRSADDIAAAETVAREELALHGYLAPSKVTRPENID